MNVLVTFDIDGTLIGQGFGGINHGEAMRHALNVLFGIDQTPNQYLHRNFVGCTDMWIAAETIKKILNVDECPKEYIDKFYKLAGEHFQQHHNGGTQLLPGVEKILKTLSEMEGVHIGLVSGNIPEIGWRKLEVCHINQYFDKNLAGLGTHMERSDIVRSMMEKCTNLYGPLTRAIHVGDAMQDVDSAIAAGALAIAVDTGRQENKIFSKPSFFMTNLEDGFNEFISIVKTGKTTTGEDHIDQIIAPQK